jgi:hypothetical protein
MGNRVDLHRGAALQAPVLQIRGEGLPSLRRPRVTRGLQRPRDDGHRSAGSAESGGLPRARICGIRPKRRWDSLA